MARETKTKMKTTAKIRPAADFEAITVPLGRLERHVRNVRAGRSGEDAAVARLAANIREIGLLQPLLVSPLDAGRYGVLAGGRRLAALERLAADRTAKGFGPRMEVACRLVPGEARLTALSLSENELHLPMDALERHEAFAALGVRDGLGIPEIARVFGVTERLVRETLRIGLVAPEIRAAHRAGQVSLETLRAFAGHPDPAVQADIHASLARGGTGEVSPWRVRQALQERGVRRGDGLGAFVLEGYLAEGGPVAANLLEEDSVLEDVGLVHRVLASRLGDMAEEARVRLGLAWAEPCIDPDWSALSAYGRVHPKPVDPEGVAVARVAALRAEMAQVTEEMDGLAEDTVDDATDRAWQALDARREEIGEEIGALTTAFSPLDAGLAGVLAIWQHGAVRLETGLVRPEEMPPVAVGEDAPEGSEDGVPALPRKLREDFAALRTRAVGLALARDPARARLYADWLIVKGVLGDGRGGASTLAARPGTERPALTAAQRRGVEAGEVTEEDCLSELERVIAAHDAALPACPLGERDAVAFAAFAALAPEERDRLVARAAAFTLEPTPARDAHAAWRDPARVIVEAAVLPDIRAVWTPGADVFGRLTKPRLLAVLGGDLGLAREAAMLGASKKSEIVARLAALFADPPETLSPEARAAVAAWCPPGMRTVADEEGHADAGEEAGDMDTVPEDAGAA